ncbi:hypothetical protein Q4S45_03105 [Massilia sp. R2A-15]|uniref:hypothetical protein n=1 Tax=Massilia sp. R2A-15 TaxID=3064278 RepID=UPI002736C5CD|nr:hypothetical protein [Massilia sp. R2A-15]WLI90126.1 hypothetical protein Q4S45_03105 [Massilia sp. R2A-15]
MSKAYSIPLIRLACAALVCLAAPFACAAPSTFGPVIGNALLCRSHLDNAYFYDYFTSAFGPAYKHEGGAFWFKADGSLWGTPVTEVMVSDDSSELVFVGAVAEASPDKLDEAIRAAAGIRHRPVDASQFPVRGSIPGSQIVYFNQKSKIYCVKYKPLPAG